MAGTSVPKWDEGCAGPAVCVAGAGSAVLLELAWLAWVLAWATSAADMEDSWTGLSAVTVVMEVPMGMTAVVTAETRVGDPAAADGAAAPVLGGRILGGKVEGDSPCASLATMSILAVELDRSTVHACRTVVDGRGMSSGRTRNSRCPGGGGGRVTRVTPWRPGELNRVRLVTRRRRQPVEWKRTRRRRRRGTRTETAGLRR